MRNREDVNFLIGANVEDFDQTGALEAYHTLMDVFLDLDFQLKVSERDFKGSDREAWATKAEYKQNRVVEAARRFSRRYRELKEESELTFLKSAIRSYLNGSTGLESTIRGIVGDD